MATSFVPAPKTEVHKGLPADAWLRAVWDHAHFAGPQAAYSVVFRDFKPVLGRPGAFFATPVGVAPFRKALRVALGEARDVSEECMRVIQRGDVVVPLGTLLGLVCGCGCSSCCVAKSGTASPACLPCPLTCRVLAVCPH